MRLLLRMVRPALRWPPRQARRPPPSPPSRRPAPPWVAAPRAAAPRLVKPSTSSRPRQWRAGPPVDPSPRMVADPVGWFSSACVSPEADWQLALKPAHRPSRTRYVLDDVPAIGALASARDKQRGAGLCRLVRSSTIVGRPECRLALDAGKSASLRRDRLHPRAGRANCATSLCVTLAARPGSWG